MSTPLPITLECQNCGNIPLLSGDKRQLAYCPVCGRSLFGTLSSSTKGLSSGQTETHGMTTEETHSPTLVPGHIPEASGIQFSIGNYQVIRSIGKGGMGEVLLAYDTNCGRRIALKRIREDLLEHRQLHNRFLKEAHITSQLTHPAIIPIYTIHEDESQAYYTMPFVEGETLKQIFKNARLNEKNRHAELYSIPSLVRHFLSICQAVAYAHSKGVLHRDLKPENIIIGPYGEVLIIDWGLAKLIKNTSSTQEESDALETSIEKPPIKHPMHGLTRFGKVVGTVSYMAPERALGQPATAQTDVYSLGVILYQILTLKSPFKRGTLKEFRKNLLKEKLISPEELAPYRDVPKTLSRIVQKCLSTNLDKRYAAVDLLIRDIENYIEGRSDWTLAAELKIDRKDNWEFQESVLIAEHVAVTRGTDVTDWVNLMISKDSFNGNTRIETRIKIKEGCQGIGFLLSIPESIERDHLNDGYSLWIGSEKHKSTNLLKSTVEVIYQPEVYLKPGIWHEIRIDKIDNSFHFTLDDTLQFSYISYLPLTGTHLGFISRDDEFEISAIQVFTGSQSMMVSCLSVPDAFLAHKNYASALSEYRRIGYSFPGTAEGREALFRAGITLLEQAKNASDEPSQEKFYDLALDEFGKLHSTPGAPLEYLGKGLVYQDLEDFDEEIKCFELALRRFPNHPLIGVIEEHVVFRMLESSLYHRQATYSFALLVTRLIPESTKRNNCKKLFRSLQKHWEVLPFILEETSKDLYSKDGLDNFAVQLSFWLARPQSLSEMIDIELEHPSPSPLLLGNALMALFELGCGELGKQKMNAIEERSVLSQIDLEKIKAAPLLFDMSSNEIEELLNNKLTLPKTILEADQERFFLTALNLFLKRNEFEKLYRLSIEIKHFPLSPLTGLFIDCNLIYALLHERKWDEADKILRTYPLELMNQEKTPLHFLYGCWLYAIEGKEIASIHFHGILDTPFPRSWSLFSHFYNGKIAESSNWFSKAFLYEKRILFRQLTLFYRVAKEETLELYYTLKEKEQYLS